MPGLTLDSINHLLHLVPVSAVIRCLHLSDLYPLEDQQKLKAKETKNNNK